MALDLEKYPQTLVPRDAKGRAWGVQCSRIRPNGERCLRYAIRGGTCCYKHGGQLKVVRAAAQARIAALAPAAVEVVAQSLDPDVPHAVRLRAARLILTWNGFSAMGVRTPGTRRSLQEPRAERNSLDQADADEIDSQIAELLARRALNQGGGVGAPGAAEPEPEE